MGWERQNMPRAFGISIKVILLYNAYQIIANEHVLTLRKDCMIHLATKYHHYSVIPPHLPMITLCLDELVMEINILITQTRGPKVHGDYSLMRQGFFELQEVGNW